MRTLILLFSVFLLTACGGPAIHPGESSREQVLSTWGPPTLRFPEEGGGERLLYSTGPAGFVTYVVITGADGKVRSVHNALKEEEFAQVRAGDNQESIVRRFGPPFWTQYFKARNELVWEWRYCDVWTYPARFNVLFDGDSGLVRSTLTVREDRGRWHDMCAPAP